MKTEDAQKIKIEKFFDEIEAVCKKYNLSISNEDYEGRARIEKYSIENMTWLRNASDDSED